ncbi:MAG: DEAD/DEAH box helicase family protein [Gammaproteobacteria bacterium]|nr:DEAD/DEAH box helicase family protein [Gammaproteobacteria bacterium]
MEQNFNISQFSNLTDYSSQYEGQLKRLSRKKVKIDQIEKTVTQAIENLNEPTPPPFIIYGEPQCGKTEMMICLTAKLLDSGYKLIVLLLNDSVDLLSQNLGRFQTSGLAPSPKNFSEIIDPAHRVKGVRHVVFCKKNARDLEKLIDKLDTLGNIVVIDDEADYATPNSKINKKDKTKINELIEKLLGIQGRYIGVTATPARLDLNNTFGNVTAKWVEFPAHELYTGQDHFFPIHKDVLYILELLSDSCDAPKYTREAFFSFLVAASYINLQLDDFEMTNYSMLIHTSGKVNDHQKDMKIIQNAIGILIDKNSPKWKIYVQEVWEKARQRFPNEDPNLITEFILKNISRHKVIVLNSKKDVSVSGQDATNPKALFTVVIGGNIVSRGVTLNNLLSMYFTRDVKHKIQQDTYIQRARMFGVRGDYLEHFELTIPKKLYSDWHRCFVYHKLSLNGARSGNPPIWITDKRVAAVANSSIDKTNVFQTKKGELSFNLFDINENIEREIFGDNGDSHESKLSRLNELLPASAFPSHLMQFVENFGGGSSKVALYEPADVSVFKPDPGRGDDIENIYRSRGFWGQFDRDKDRSATHHFKIFHFNRKKGRLFYKYDCDDISSLSFLWNSPDYG